jgi:ferric-dicitrate binding protein FerR (iron transport regulator)
MSCNEVQSLLSGYVDQELLEADRQPLDEHIAACMSCRAALETLRRQDAELRAAFAPRREVATAVAEGVIGQLRSLQPPQVRTVRWLPLAASLFSAAAGFLLAFVLLRPSQPTKQGPVVHEIVRDVPVILYGPAAPSPDQLASEDKPRVELALATGRVEMCPPGLEDWRPMPTGEKLNDGTRVRTPAGVRCEFRCPDGSEVRLNGGTEITFKTRRALAVEQGQVFSTVAKDVIPFEVSVPDAKVTALGTEFDVQCQPRADTVLTVVDGSTQIDGRAGQHIVKQGERATLRGGLLVNRGDVRDLVQATNWVHELLVLKGRDNKELEKRINVLLAQLGHEKLRYLHEPEIRALGDHCVLPLTRFVQSDLSAKRTQHRHAAMHILADLAQPWSIPDLIRLLDDQDVQVRYEAARALRRLVGRDAELNIDPQRWRAPSVTACQPFTAEVQQWWNENRQRYPGIPLLEDIKAEQKGKQ